MFIMIVFLFDICIKLKKVEFVYGIYLKKLCDGNYVY